MTEQDGTSVPCGWGLSREVSTIVCSFIYIVQGLEKKTMTGSYMEYLYVAVLCHVVSL